VKGFAAHVYSRLSRIDAQPEVAAADAGVTTDLAESAESPEGKSWVVRLRRGVKFQNLPPLGGRELKAEGVLFSWRRLTDPKSPGVTLVPKGATLQNVDDYTLRFTLPQPSPTFLDFLADANALWVMPKESDGGFDPIKQPIGSGPLILENYAASSRMTYKRNPDHFVKGMPYLDGVDNAIIPEYANYKAQFDAGNLHALSPRTTDILDMRKLNTKLQWTGVLNRPGFDGGSDIESRPPSGLAQGRDSPRTRRAGRSRGR